MKLKIYQRESLDAIAGFCDRVRTNVRNAVPLPVHAAYREMTGHEYHAVPQLAETPYVCLRVPTGGGKTIIAAHAVGKIARRLAHEERPLCLWVTPSTTIRDQTLHGLKTRRHPYHEALRESLGGTAVEVLTMEEALSASRAMLSAAAVVVVTTIQSYRIDDDTGRKVYQDNGYLMDHFRDLPDWIRQQIAEPEDGRVRLSLANVMRLRGPVVIMDEAHNARTRNSFESLSRFSPLAVLELTATPQNVHNPDKEKYASNVLHAVSALQLKQEGMIKLPIELESRNDWLEVLAQTVHRREELEERATKFYRETGRYIRPIALLQAQPKSKTKSTHTVDVIRKTLLERLNIPAEHVRIATGEHDDLGVQDLRGKDCPVRYVITVDKLREGWDCPFAYVLGSVGNVATETAVEQLLGRVMRMPHAEPTGDNDLDRAYAIVESENVVETARNLRDSLVKRCGFDNSSADEAMRIHMEDEPGSRLPLDSIPVSQPVNVGTLPPEIRSKVVYRADIGVLVVKQELTRQETLTLRDALPEDDQEAVEDFWTEFRPVGAAGKKLDEYAPPLVIPQLTICETDSAPYLFEPMELDEFQWDMEACPTEVSENVFSTDLEVGSHVELGLNDAGGVQIGSIASILSPTLRFWSEEDNWSREELAAWLDKEIHHGGAMVGLEKKVSVVWLRRLIDSLLAQRGCDFNILARKRHALAEVARRMIMAHCRKQIGLAAERLVALRNPGRRLETSLAIPAILEEPKYAPYRKYAGMLTFKKHAFELVGDMNIQEELCAAELEKHPNVCRWVRNLEHETAGGISLPLSPGLFFPDFIAELNDGRVAMIEYKGAHLANLPEERHKRSVGELWASRSDGTCVFSWVVDKDWATLHSDLSEQ